MWSIFILGRRLKRLAPQILKRIEMGEKEILRKDICDELLRIREKNPNAMILEGLVVNAYLTEEKREEMEKKLARLKELEQA